IRSTTSALATPNPLRGRVNSVENVFISASNELGAFESGAAAALLGPVPAVVAGGGIPIAIARVWPRPFPALPPPHPPAGGPARLGTRLTGYRPSVRPLAVTMSAAVLVLAACGSESRVQQRPRPKLPSAVAASLASRSDVLAAALRRGDGCAARIQMHGLERQ